MAGKQLGQKDGRKATNRYDIGSHALDRAMPSSAIDTLSVTGLAKGERVLYVQATESDGKQTEVVKFPFTVN